MQLKERLGLSGIVLAFAIVVSVLGAASASADNSHRVKQGETLSEIAEEYGIPLSVLAAQNHISDYDVIFAGNDLVLPGSSSASGSQAMRSAPASTSLYTVQPGDSLWTIASTRRTTMQQLIAANPDIADPDHIFVDQTLSLPGGGESASTSGKTMVQPVSGGDVPTLIAAYARSYGLEPALVQALAWQESGWNQRMVSSSGALGVMQIMPATGAWLASDVVGQPLDVANSTVDNIHAGVAYLRFLIDRTGSIEYGLAAYYQGPGSLQINGMLPETQHYVANVLAIRSYLATYGTPPRG